MFLYIYICLIFVTANHPHYLFRHYVCLSHLGIAENTYNLEQQILTISSSKHIRARRNNRAQVIFPWCKQFGVINIIHCLIWRDLSKCIPYQVDLPCDLISVLAFTFSGLKKIKCQIVLFFFFPKQLTVVEYKAFQISPPPTFTVLLPSSLINLIIIPPLYI